MFLPSNLSLETEKFDFRRPHQISVPAIGSCNFLAQVEPLDIAQPNCAFLSFGMAVNPMNEVYYMKT